LDHQDGYSGSRIGGRGFNPNNISGAGSDYGLWGKWGGNWIANPTTVLSNVY